MSLTAVIVGGVIPGMFLLAGGFLAWWLRRKPEELNTMGKLLADVEKLRDRVVERDGKIDQLQKDRREDREINARWRYHAMRYIERLITHAEHQNEQLAAAGQSVTPPEPLPDELKPPPTGA